MSSSCHVTSGRVGTVKRSVCFLTSAVDKIHDLCVSVNRGNTELSLNSTCSLNVKGLSYLIDNYKCRSDTSWETKIPRYYCFVLHSYQ